MGSIFLSFHYIVPRVAGAAYQIGQFKHPRRQARHLAPGKPEPTVFVD
jgi:hypothetical protein